MALKKNLSLFLFCSLVLTNPLFAAGQEGEGNPFQVLASKVEEKVRPLFEASSPAPKKKTAKGRKKNKKKTYLEKIQEDRQEFNREAQERKVKFLRKVRTQDLTDEERQRKIVKFHAKELERNRKIAEKEKREILKNSKKKDKKA